MDILAIIGGIATVMLLITLHELGHLLAARKFGVGVEQFSIGLGPKLKRLSKKGRLPVYWRLIPLGGFVNIKGEKIRRSKMNESVPGKSLEDISWIKQIIVHLAGIGVNFILAIIILTALFLFLPEDTEIAYASLRFTFIKLPSSLWILAPIFAFKATFIYCIKFFLTILKRIPIIVSTLFTSPLVPREGGLGDTFVAWGNIVSIGFWEYLGFVYLFSLLLIALNMLPFLPFDGGQAVVSAAGRIFKKGMALNILIAVSFIIGAAIIGTIIILVLIGDIHALLYTPLGIAVLIIGILIVLKFILSKTGKKKE
ncbi:site-2 protease family protein [Patescibacteria group bacterium AH-259-L07]|nr:site-2 protease family protein [Patescibacteria group bacterium AH-259-L07]